VEVECMKRVLVSVGPIPGKLDSVKLVTNRFKGGLAFATASMLAKFYGFEVAVVKWKGTAIPSNMPNPDALEVINVEDVYDYRDKVWEYEADAYIMAAAVANLVPARPWEGKFPSHDYEVGDEFDIKFTIAPRIIDGIKERHPSSTVIGYKLFDGPEHELVRAGWHTLVGSKSTVIFCNTPDGAKRRKIAMTADGACLPMDFEDHVGFIARAANLDWYRTDEVYRSSDALPSTFAVPREALDFLDSITVKQEPYEFGTFAMRDGDGFWTTKRGKRPGEEERLAKVFSVDHDKRVVTASVKATMNAPTLHRIFEAFPDVSFIAHGHDFADLMDAGIRPEELHQFDYVFPGTTEEVDLITDELDRTPGKPYVFVVKGHGYYALLQNFKQTEALDVG
jgi:hypothetical protein